VSITLLLSFHLLTCSSQSTIQKVSVPCFLLSFHFPHSFLPMPFPGGECPSLTCFVSDLTCLSRCAFQDVSVLHSLTFLLCPQLFLPMNSPGCECPLTLSLSLCATYWFCSMHSSVCECPCFLTSCPCPHLLPPMCFPGCEFLSLLLSFYILTYPS
jgi:hypothetical protein